MAEVEKLILQLEARVNKYEKDLARARSQTNRVAGDIERRIDRMGASIGRTFRGQLLAGVTGIAAVLGTRELIRYADGWTQVQNRLLAVGVASSDVAARQEELFQVAIRSRTAFQSVANSYARLKLSSEQLGLADSDLLRITETLSKALQVGGATAGEAASAALQLSQALGSGFLQGDELRALRENAPVIAKAIADEFGVTVGALKELGAQGQLSSERVAKAILKATGQVDQAFGRTKLTVGQALTNVESAFQRYIGEANSALGVTDAVAEGLTALAENIGVVADVTLALAAVIATALLGRALNPALLAFVTLNRGLAAVASAFLTAGVAGGRLSAAMLIAQLRATTLTGAMARLGGVMRFLGPGGILAVAVTLFALFVDAETDAARAADAVAASLSRLSAALSTLDRDSEDDVKAARAMAAAQIALATAFLARAKAEAEIGKVKDPFGGRLFGGFADEAAEAAAAIEADITRAQELLDEFVNGTGSGGGLPPALDPSKAAQKRADAIADLEREIQLNNELIANYGRGEDVLNGLKAAYDALAEAKKAGFEEGTNDFETFVAGKAQLEFQRRQLDLLKDGAELTKSLRNKEQERADTLAQLNQLLKAGAISQETYNLAVEQASAEYERQKALLEELQSFGERAFDRIGSAITEAFVQGEGAAIDFLGVAKGILNELLQEMIKLAILNPLKNSLFNLTGDNELPTLGGLSSIIGSIGTFFGGGSSSFNPGVGPGGLGFTTFGGPRAGGGPVSAGSAYLVGEKRPELFMPRTSGTIIPQVPGAAPPAPPVVVNVINRAPDTTTETRETTEGGQESVVVIVDKIVADRIGRPGTASNRALEQLGVRRPLVRR